MELKIVNCFWKQIDGKEITEKIIDGEEIAEKQIDGEGITEKIIDGEEITEKIEENTEKTATAELLYRAAMAAAGYQEAGAQH